MITIEDGKVIDEQTGMILADAYDGGMELAHLDDATILALYGWVNDAAGQSAEGLNRVRAEIENRMKDRDATLIVGEGWQAKREMVRSYTYVLDLATSLAAMGASDPALAGMVARAVQIIPASLRLNKTGLNQLAKVGGDVKTLIERGTIVSEVARVKVERR